VWVALGEGSGCPGGDWAARYAAPDDPALVAVIGGALADGRVVLVLGSHLLVAAMRARAVGELAPADPQDPRATQPDSGVV
jgi:hypothetical protein